MFLFIFFFLTELKDNIYKNQIGSYSSTVGLHNIAFRQIYIEKKIFRD